MSVDQTEIATHFKDGRVAMIWKEGRICIMGLTSKARYEYHIHIQLYRLDLPAIFSFIVVLYWY